MIELSFTFSVAKIHGRRFKPFILVLYEMGQKWFKLGQWPEEPICSICMLWDENNFYRAMHFSAKRSIAITYVRHDVRLSVCPPVTLVDQDHRLEILETNCTDT